MIGMAANVEEPGVPRHHLLGIMFQFSATTIGAIADALVVLLRDTNGVMVFVRDVVSVVPTPKPRGSVENLLSALPGRLFTAPDADCHWIRLTTPPE